tara:strand:- start:476 stop:985 length:510 start_codon:yes stop_codon:yes gene_type:complete
VLSTIRGKMNNLKTAIYDENSKGISIICPNCGAGAGPNNTVNEIPFTHVRLQEDHSRVKGIDASGNLIIDFGGDIQYYNGDLSPSEYLSCNVCETKFLFNGKTSLEDIDEDMSEDIDTMYVTETNLDQTFFWAEEPHWSTTEETDENKRYTSYTSVAKDKTDPDDDIPF